MKLTFSAATALAICILPDCLFLASAHAANPVPVVVELFTSEGCSSCPPADALLSRYVQASPVADVEIIALGEHVDYWNHGGWVDPYSSAQFSARQSDYSRAFHLNTVYTPQIVVDGEVQCVGSDKDSARAAIMRAARQPRAQVSVSENAPGFLSVSISHLPRPAQNTPIDVYLAVTEDGLTSSIGGGENSGRRLTHSAVVRELTPLGTVIGGTFTASPAVTLKPGWRRGHLHAVVFAQGHASRSIVGATEILL